MSDVFSGLIKVNVQDLKQTMFKISEHVRHIRERSNQNFETRYVARQNKSLLRKLFRMKPYTVEDLRNNRNGLCLEDRLSYPSIYGYEVESLIKDITKAINHCSDEYIYLSVASASKIEEYVKELK